ncbi:MAG TPA: type I secretion system permease/ATPase [Alphaproteobacteria bacterium]|nr:type I secretion system permease/ATPase [Alphaproteobacteria bacterium]
MATQNKSDVIASLRRLLAQGMLFALLLSFFLSLLQLTVPLFMLQVYDRVMSSRSLETLTMLVIVAVGCLVVFGILDFIRGRVYLVIGDAIGRRLNTPAVEAAVRETIEGQGREANQAIRDLSELRGFVTGNAISVPLELVWAPLFLVVLFLLHPAYGAVAIASAVVLILFGVLGDITTRRPLEEARKTSNRGLADVSAAVRHAEVIDAMGMLPAIARRWQRTQERTLGLMLRGGSNAKAIAASSRSARFSMQIAILATGAVLVIDHEVTAGSMIAASIIMGRLLLPFEQLIEGWRQWVFAHAAYKRINEILAEGRNKRQTMPLPRPDGRLTVDQLVYLPPGQDHPVIKGIAFNLEPGEVLGVIGPSAAGKSTLARLIVGVLAPTAGSVSLDGHNVYQWERESFGNYVGYLPQNVALLDGTVRDNIARMRDADPKLVVEAARKAGVHEMIGRLPFGYDTPIGESGPNLSGGQRQRIALARALFGDPRLLVLDEPNANLDHEGERALLRTIEAAKRAGTTVVLIAHRPSIVTVVDKLLVLNDGRIEQFGPRTDVIKSVTPSPAVLRRGGVAQLGQTGAKE